MTPAHRATWASGVVRSGGIVDLAVVATAFAVVFVGELPDKTMVASLVLSTRGRPAAVWVGAAAAFVIQVAVAVTLGAVLVRLVPGRELDTGVAAIFLAGAVWALWSWHRQEPEAAEQPDNERAEAPHSAKRTVGTAFVVIFVAEWGDLTQILTADLAAKTGAALSVAIGAVVALWTVAALAVLGGRGLLRVINPRTLRAIIAFVLLGLAVVSALQAAT